MKKDELSISVLGARGSMAKDRADCALFGGDTSCYMVRAGEETVFLDAGSGLLSAPASYPHPPVILLSHLHLDHILGLGMYPAISRRGQRIELYVPFCKEDGEASQLLGRVYSPPVWPLRLEDFESDLVIRAMPERLQVGELSVETMPGNHPCGSMIYRLTYSSRTIVYATDYEHSEASLSELAAFAHNADLLMYDGQFSTEEYEKCRGFGHSTAEKGVELMHRCGAKKLLVIHHSPGSTDERLLLREKQFPAERVHFARAGETISL